MHTIQKREWRTQLWFLLLVGLLGGYGATTQAANPEPAGWYAGDMHVHRSCGGPPEAISSLKSKMATNNLAVISLLADMGNGEVQNSITDLPIVNGQDASISSPGRIVHWDAEWHWDPTFDQYSHRVLGGHIVLLGLSEAHQIWEEFTYPIIFGAYQQNGISGFAHMQYVDIGIPQSLNCCKPIEYPVEVALNEADFISEDVIGDDAAVLAYYRLLNNGFRPAFAAGTDYPCGVSVLGGLLTYVQVPAPLQMTYRNWIEGLDQGRTVVSRNGHNEFLNLTVDGTATPGDEIKLTGSNAVQVTIKWTAQQSLSGTIELVQNGVVIASKQASVAAGGSQSLTATVNFAKSGWLAARRMGNNGHQLHTGAVFVTVNGLPVRVSKADAEFYVQWMDNLLEKTSPGGAWNIYFENNINRLAAQARYQAAKEIYQKIAVEAGAAPPPDTIAPTVSIASPKNNAAVKGIVPITAVAADNVGVAKVEFYRDNKLLSTDTTRPYTFNWNTTSVADGTYTLRVKGYDKVRNIGISKAVVVTVANTKANIVLRQRASKTTSSAQSLTTTLPANVAAGNFIAVSLSGWSNLPALPTVTDTRGNKYSIAGKVLISQGAYSAIYYAKNVKAGKTSVSVKTVRAGGQISMAIAEFSGVDKISPLDKAVGTVGAGNAPSSGNMTPRTAGELVIGSGTHLGNTVTTVGSNFTMIAVPTEDSDSHQPLAMEFRVLPKSLPTTATFRLGTSYGWTQNGALFKHK